MSIELKAGTTVGFEPHNLRIRNPEVRPVPSSVVSCPWSLWYPATPCPNCPDRSPQSFGPGGDARKRTTDNGRRTADQRRFRLGCRRPARRPKSLGAIAMPRSPTPASRRKCCPCYEPPCATSHLATDAASPGRVRPDRRRPDLFRHPAAPDCRLDPGPSRPDARPGPPACCGPSPRRAPMPCRRGTWPARPSPTARSASGSARTSWPRTVPRRLAI